MFNLEQSIADWRKQMLAAGIKSPVPVEELESHLRDYIASLIKSGLSEKRAFEAAAQQIGQANTLQREFKKMEGTLVTKVAIIALGIFVVLFGPAVMLPALAKHRDLGIWNYEIVWPTVLGAIITLAGIGITILGFKKRRT